MSYMTTRRLHLKVHRRRAGNLHFSQLEVYDGTNPVLFIENWPESHGGLCAHVNIWGVATTCSIGRAFSHMRIEVDNASAALALRDVLGPLDFSIRRTSAALLNRLPA